MKSHETIGKHEKVVGMAVLAYFIALFIIIQVFVPGWRIF